ncbi:hypothetical protein [Nocardiopsis sp. NPDC058789]|uniref:Uncharacterized protein n=1 Tax=Nocardiopsis eucommiae TaxID=2831970 RepID=A0A975LAD6_9ACTN|nr:hypothetical protein KGD82_02300 [Nocardiopsis eucommiae]
MTSVRRRVSVLLLSVLTASTVLGFAVAPAQAAATPAVGAPSSSGGLLGGLGLFGDGGLVTVFIGNYQINN